MKNVVFKNHLISENKTVETIVFKGCEVGFVISEPKFNILVEQTFFIPDIRRGVNKNGSCYFRRFCGWCDAIHQIEMDFDEIIKIFNSANFNIADFD